MIRTMSLVTCGIVFMDVKKKLDEVDTETRQTSGGEPGMDVETVSVHNGRSVYVRAGGW